MPEAGPGPILVLTPVGRDGPVIAGMLQDAGLAAEVIESFSSGARFAASAALIAAEEAFERFDPASLYAWLADQPPWSDYPVVLLRTRNAPVTPAVQAFIGRLGNVTILERPLHPITLVSAARSAMRARQRQLEAGAFLIERLRVAETLRESEARFRTVADSAPALIWMTSADGELVYANPRHAELFGERAPGGDWLDAVHHEDLATVQATLADAVTAQAPFSTEFRVFDQAGEIRWLRCEAAPRAAAGHYEGHVGCAVDITEARLTADQLERRVQGRTAELAAANRQLLAEIAERERMEATVLKMQRLEAVGQLTAGVAHDFNNLLTVIIGNLTYLEREAATAGGKRRLEMMRVAAERGAKLTSQLLAFSRRQRLEPKPVNLNEAIGGLDGLLQSTLGGAIRLQMRLDPQSWPALVDPTQIEMVILNLAINARDAMDVGGTIVVETANARVAGPRGRPEEPEPGEYVVLSISDTGSGMPADVLERVFEPFFTTKAVGKGSGLGLSQVLGFAKQSGGGVRIETRPGDGTTVRVYLPRASGAPAEKPPSLLAESLQVSGKGAVVLLVDDDESVRETTASMLCELGFGVVEAGSGGAALEILDSPRKIDLLLLDFAMPGMNGAEVARAAAARRPGLPILFVTGYADLAEIKSVGEHRIIRKPFGESELARRLVSALGDEEEDEGEDEPSAPRLAAGP